MPVVSVINYKGGVGKTTTTANLAAELAWRGKRVLLLDLDAQASLTFSFVRPDQWSNDLAVDRTIKSWYESFGSGAPIELRSLIFHPDRVNERLRGRGELQLIPSHLGLINVDLELATQLGGATLKQSKINFLNVHRRLLDGLDGMVEEVDLVLIDCPPNFNIVTKTAIAASDQILIPAKPDYLSTLGIDYLIRNLNELIGEFNEYAMLDEDHPEPTISPEVLGVVFTMIQIRDQRPISAQRPYIAQTRNLGVPVFDAWIRENKTLFSDAPEYGVPVVLNHYSGDTYRGVVGELEGFVSEFESRVGLT
jgi:chromosome partitioning protein